MPPKRKSWLNAQAVTETYQLTSTSPNVGVLNVAANPYLLRHGCPPIVIRELNHYADVGEDSHGLKLGVPLIGKGGRSNRHGVVSSQY